MRWETLVEFLCSKSWLCGQKGIGIESTYLYFWQYHRSWWFPMQYLHRLSLRLRSHICCHLAANPGTPFYPPLRNQGGDTPPGAVTAHQCGPTRIPDCLRRPPMLTHHCRVDDARQCNVACSSIIVDMHRSWHWRRGCWRRRQTKTKGCNHGQEREQINNERPGLVLILAGSVCNIFIYFWYISMVS